MQIEGPADAPAVEHLTDLPFPPADESTFTWYGAIGVSRREMVLVLADGVTVGEANDLLGSISARVIGSDAAGGLLLLQLPDADSPGPILEVWDRLLDDPRVAAVMVEDATMRELALPPNAIDPADSRNRCPALPARRGTQSWVWEVPSSGSSPAGDNWGVVRSRVPQAWNLRDVALAGGRGAEVQVGVIDTGFFTSRNDDAPAVDLHGGDTNPTGSDAEYHACSDGASCTSNADCPDGRCDGGTCTLVSCDVSATACPTGTACGQAADGKWYCYRVGSQVDHGATVAGIIGARWDDGEGVTGVVPYPVRIAGHVGKPFELVAQYATGERTRPRFVTGRVLSQVLELVRDPHVRAINNSYGACPYFCPGGDQCIDPAVGVVIWLDENGASRRDTWASYIARWGEVYHRAIERTVRDNLSKVVLVSAAGNCGAPKRANRTGHTCTAPHDTVTYQAAHCSPLNAAAAANPGTYYLSVSAIDWAGDPAGFSERNASVAAPGEQVRSVENDDDWDDDMDGDDLHTTRNGTSFAAPFVTGLIAYLWELYPDLEASEIIALVDDPARYDEPIDFFGAALAIDEIREGLPVQSALADLDDGSADGNTRWRILEPGCEAPVNQSSDLCEERTAAGARGDGAVDVRDLRALRDAILQAGGADLNGGPDNPRKDMNGDGCVTDSTGTSRTIAGGGESCSVAPDENVFPRSDLDGDGVASAADLEVLAGVWGTTMRAGARAVTFGYQAGEALAGLLQSGDVHLDLSDVEAQEDAADRVTIEVTGLPQGLELTGQPAETVVTVPVGSEISVRARGWAGEEEVYCLEDTVAIETAGQDVLARPGEEGACEPAHFWLETGQSRGFVGGCAYATASYFDEEIWNGGDDASFDPPDPDGQPACALQEVGQPLAGADFNAGASVEGASGNVAVGMAAESVDEGAQFTITFSADASGVKRDAGVFEAGSSAAYSLYPRIRTDLPESLWDDWQIVVTCEGSASASYIDPEYTGSATWGASNAECAVVAEMQGETSWEIGGTFEVPLRDAIASGDALQSAGSVSAGSAAIAEEGDGSASLSGTLTFRVQRVPEE